jgi:hypothetical protein
MTKKDHPFAAIKLVDYLNKFVNNHIHWRLPNCKQFGTLHAFCSMREFVKWTCHLKLYNALLPSVFFNCKTTNLVTWKCSPTWNCHIVSWKNVNIMQQFQLWPNCSLMFIKKEKSSKTTYININDYNFHGLKKNYILDSHLFPINSIKSRLLWNHRFYYSYICNTTWIKWISRNINFKDFIVEVEGEKKPSIYIYIKCKQNL